MGNHRRTRKRLAWMLAALIVCATDQFGRSAAESPFAAIRPAHYVYVDNYEIGVTPVSTNFISTARERFG